MGLPKTVVTHEEAEAKEIAGGIEPLNEAKNNDACRQEAQAEPARGQRVCLLDRGCEGLDHKPVAEAARKRSVCGSFREEVSCRMRSVPAMKGAAVAPEPMIAGKKAKVRAEDSAVRSATPASLPFEEFPMGASAATRQIDVPPATSSPLSDFKRACPCLPRTS